VPRINHVSSLTAHKLRLYLKQHNLQVSGGKATLVARVLRYVRAAQQILEPEDNDATSDSKLQSSDSEDPDDSKDDAQSDSSEMGDFIETLVSNASQYIASKGFRYIYYICRWWLGGGAVLIFGRWGGGQS